MLWWTLKGTLILLLALAAAALLRRKPAAVRHAVLALAIGAQLLLPFVPRLRLVPRVVSAPAALAVPARASRAVPAAPGIAWLLPAGSALLLLRLLAGTLRVRHISRRARKIADEPIPILTTGRLTMPVTWGFLRPKVLLPASSARWSEAMHRHVLLHELAHVRRRDALTQLVAELALALYWFNPLLWLAVRRMRAEAEHACDDAVLRGGERPSVYAETLVQLVRAQVGRGAFPALSAGSRSDLEARVRAITHPHRDPAARRTLLAATMAMATLLVLPLAALHPRPGSVRRCHPMLIDHFPYLATTGTLTANGVTTHYFFQRPDDGRCLEASFPLDVRFRGDGCDVVATPGLQALVHETHGATDRVVYLEEQDGRLERRYVVDGEEAEWDADAERWYARVLPDAIRRTTPSVEEIARKRG